MARVNYKPLCDAIFKGDIAQLRREIDTNPDAVAHWKPITDAAFCGHADAIDLLVRAGADCNIKSGTGSKHTPLTRLCQHHKTIPKHERHTKALRRLLSHGADPGVPAGPLDLRPFEYAAMGPHTDLMKVLKKLGPKLDVFSAAAACSLGRLSDLSVYDGLHVLDWRGRTPLHYVALSGLHHLNEDRVIRCARYLINQGIEVDELEPIPDGNSIFYATALWYAISWQGNRNLTKYLLNQDANPSIPVFAALWSGDLEICEMLDEKGANWNQSFEGLTPLMEMFRFNRTKLVSWLLDKDVDVSIQDPEGKTALDYAINRKARPELIDLLKERLEQ